MALSLVSGLLGILLLTQPAQAAGPRTVKVKHGPRPSAELGLRLNELVKLAGLAQQYKSGLDVAGPLCEELMASNQSLQSEVERQERRIRELETVGARLAALQERVRANSENARATVPREIAEAEFRKVQKVATELAGHIADLERALAGIHKREAALADGDTASSDGIKLVIRGFRDKLGRMGIEQVDSPSGSEYNPHLQEAVQEMPAPTGMDVASGRVLFELSPAYVYRHALFGEEPRLLVAGKVILAK